MKKKDVGVRSYIYVGIIAIIALTIIDVPVDYSDQITGEVHGSFGSNLASSFVGLRARLLGQISCSDECSYRGAKICSGTGIRTCGYFDRDACLDLSPLTSCSNGCTDGACNTVSCTDSDGGKDTKLKGTTTNLKFSTRGEWTDICLKDNQRALPSQENILLEGYCGSDGIGDVEMINCPNGCSDGVCKSGSYTVSIGLGAKPTLYDGTFQVPITCNRGNLGYNCGDQIINSKISKAYAYIKDSSGIEIQRFDLINDAGFGLFSGNFDYNPLTDELYTLGVYAEDINGVKAEEPNYVSFSGQGWNLCETNLECSEHHSCVNNKCMLDNIDYKIGFVYLYNGSNTYNPNWRTEFKTINNKVINSIKSLTNNKVNLTIEVLGEVNTGIFCWNPAEIGIKATSSSGSSIYFPQPGSQFTQVSQSFTGKSVELIDCDNCIVEVEGIKKASPGNNVCWAGNNIWETQPGTCNSNLKPFYCDGSKGELILDCTMCGCNQGEVCSTENGQCWAGEIQNSYNIKMSCDNPLSYSNLFESNKLNELNQYISNQLSFKFSDYEGIFIIFGKLGDVLPEESIFAQSFKCNNLGGGIGGYANLIMAENSVKSSGLISCPVNSYYQEMGWHTMVHEILHRFGTVDIYDTGTIFGYDPSFNRNRARLIDPKADESIMSNGMRSCYDDGNYELDGNVCTQQELERVYLDKYNKQKMGINP